MKPLFLLPFLCLLTSCYNPELPSDADQYFASPSWNQGRLVKAFLVEIALGNRDDALFYLGSHPTITHGQKPSEEEFDAFAKLIKQDLERFQTNYTSERNVFSPPQRITFYGVGGSYIEHYRPYEWGAYTLVGIVIPVKRSPSKLRANVFYEINVWCQGPGMYQKHGGEYDHYWAKAKEQCKILDFQKVDQLNILLNYL